MTTNEKVELIRRTATETLIELAATTGPSPRSGIYLKVGMDMVLANIVQTVMVDEGWIIATSDTIRITDKGRKLVDSCCEAVRL